MRALLYARHSSDLQNERSAEDQLAALRQLLAARGWSEAGAYVDRGISGSALTTRPGVQALMRHAAAGGGDLVLVEALDRLSRGQADIARLYELLSFYGLRIETLSSGQVSELHIGLEGTMNRLFLVELGKKTRRGLVARVEAGFSGGGRCYGYSIAGKGVLAIEPAEAAIVQRIFDDYNRGLSPRAIAQRLNTEGVAGPRGKQWTAASINGDRRAGDGILHQELYVGVRVFNRRHFRKHPETGRRAGVLNPPEQWIRKPAPELRILEDAAWTLAQARKAALGALTRPQAARRPKRLLSGLLRCSGCGGAMVLQRERYVCATRRERGTCANGRSFSADQVEARVIAGVKQHLLAPAAVADFVRQFHKEAQADHQAAQAGRAHHERELAEVKRRTDRAWEAYDDGLLSKADFGARMAALAERRQAAEAGLAAAATPQPAFTLHPKAAEAFRQLVEQLEDALQGEDAQEAREAFRPLLSHVVLTPGLETGEFALNVAGKITALLGEPNKAALLITMGAGARSCRKDQRELAHFAA